MDSNLYSCIDLILRASAQFGYIREDGEVFGYTDQWCGLLEKMEQGPNAWIRLVKHKIASFYAAAQGAVGDKQKMPVPPKGLEDDKPLFLLGHRWCRWFGLFRRSKSPHYQEFLVTILQGVKKGCPRASESGLKEACRDTVAMLSGPVPKPPVVMSIRSKHPSLPVQAIDILKDCRRTVRELFSGKFITPDSLVCGLPSTSSTYFHSRSQYGAVSEVARHLKDKLGDGTLVPSWDPQLERIFDLGELRRFEKGLPDDWTQDDGSNEIVPSVSVNSKHMESFQQFRMIAAEQLLNDAFEELPLVKPVALPEALKVRVITKGPALMGYVLAPLQKFMHDTLRRHPAFELIGTPVTADLLKRRLGRLPKDYRWLSGDYKDATNGLLSIVSETICDEICRQSIYPSDLSANQKVKLSILFKRALTGHYIEDEEGNLLAQTNGQLMGSIVSFPILCIANAALCRRVIEEDTGRRHSLAQCPLLINGDDCVFPAKGEGAVMWERLCHAYNMKPSIGKTYWSEKFLNINSTTFETVHWDEDPNVPEFLRSWYFFEVKYINYGLVLHMKRSGGTMGTESVFDKFCNFGQNSGELLRTLPDFCKESVYADYIRNFGQIAKTCNIKVPWYVPQHYGGVGIRPFGKRQFGEKQERGPSLKDRRVCSLLKKDGIVFPSFTRDQKWSIHKSVSDMFKASASTDDSTEYDKYYGVAVASVFYRAVLTDNYELLYADGKQHNTVKLLRRAEKIWSKSLPKTDTREIDPWEEVPKSFPYFHTLCVESV